MKMNKKLLIPAILILGLLISTGYGAYLSYKAYVEIYGEKYPLGILELDIGKLAPIEGLEAREDYLGEMRVWTYSDDAQLVLQLAQLSQIVTNFRSFTVKVCLPLDVVFVVDLTGSMTPYMDAVKAEMLDLMWVLNTMNKSPNRFAAVGFYDYPWETVQNADGLTYNYGQVETFIAGMAAGGGAGWPQSHYLGFERAKLLFETATDPSSFANDKIVVFIGDAESGFNDLPEFTHAMNAAWDLAGMGVKIHSVLCYNPPTPPAKEEAQYEYYATISNGNFVPAPLPACRFVPGVTSNPTWIVKLTPITPFDSFRLKLRSSEPTHKEGFYTFHIWVDFFCKAVPWHEFFVTELMANLEKAEIPPWLPPPPMETPEPPPPIFVSLGVDPIEIVEEGTVTFTYEITSPPEVTPVKVTLDLFPPVSPAYNIYEDAVVPIELGPYDVVWTHSIGDDLGLWQATVTYEFTWMGGTFYAGAFANFNVVAP